MPSNILSDTSDSLRVTEDHRDSHPHLVYHMIADLCIQNISGWSNLSENDISIKQLRDGLSNKTFRVVRLLDKDGTRYSSLREFGGDKNETQMDEYDHCVNMDEEVSRKMYIRDGNAESREIPFGSKQPESYLFRIYGKDAKIFYEAEHELKVFSMLSMYQISPRLIGCGDGWRIEEWHDAVSVPVPLFSNLSVLCQLASQIARMHKLHTRSDFPLKLFSDRLGPSWCEVSIKKWLGIVTSDLKNLEKIKKMESCLQFSPDNLKNEVEWLLSKLNNNVNQNNKICKIKEDINENEMKGNVMGMDIVFCHNDIQPNNILQMPYGLRLIDFEYSSFNFQGFDIANLFVECTTDYTSEKYPFFTIDDEKYPCAEIQRIFASIYLSEYYEKNILSGDEIKITNLLKNVELCGMASHILWSLWSVIRAPEDNSNSTFGYLKYAESRWCEYRRIKNSLISMNEN